MVEPGHPQVSVRRQCELLSLSRSGLYAARAVRPSEEDVTMMNRIDQVMKIIRVRMCNRLMHGRFHEKRMAPPLVRQQIQLLKSLQYRPDILHGRDVGITGCHARFPETAVNDRF